MKHQGSFGRSRTLGLVSVAVVAMTIAALIQPAAAVAPAADLSIRLSHAPATPVTGQAISFRIAVSNAGPNAAVNVVAALPLPYELEVISATSSVGSCRYEPGLPLVICRSPSLGSGGSMTATVVVRSQVGGVAHLEAAAASDTADPDGTNSTSDDTLIVQLGPPWAEQVTAGYYRDILGRNASPAELAFWTPRIQAARNRQLPDIAFAFLQSSEYRRARIVAAYAALLSRSPGAGGLTHWLSYLQRGGTFERMTVLIVGSPEFLRRAGGTPGFVNAAYGAILGRPADAAGRDYWNGRLAGGTTPGQVANALQFSRDGLNHIITARVQTALHHNPTNAERAYWFLGFSLGIDIEHQTALLYGRGSYLSQFADPYCCLGGGGYLVTPQSAATQARTALHRNS